MLYRWPQGRILRVIMLLAVILITLDLGWGSYAQWVVWESADATEITSLVYMSLLGVLAAGVLIVGIAMIGFIPKTAQFLIEVEQEMTKVTWPSRADLIRSTILIAVMAIVLAGLIALIDVISFGIIRTWLLGG